VEYAVQRTPNESGRLKGIAYDLWLPDEDGSSPAVVVLHGAGSQKENHADFARVATSHGFVALTFDNRGHGQSEGKLSPRTIADVQRLVRMLTERAEVDARRVAVRGSSMGGLLAIHAAAATTDIAAVVAICPATEALILEDLRRVARGEPAPPGSALTTMRVDAPALAAWLEEHDVRDAVTRLDSKPLMLVHARDDEVVPQTISEELYQRATEPKRILVLEDGHHRSAQHDTEVQGETLRWLARVM